MQFNKKNIKTSFKACKIKIFSKKNNEIWQLKASCHFIGDFKKTLQLADILPQLKQIVEQSR